METPPEPGVRIPPIVTVVGPSDSGKTTMVESLVPLFRERGLSVATVKHSMHGFDVDRPGKDTWRHKQAGACATVAACPGRVTLVRDVAGDLPLVRIAQEFFREADLVLAEGYKREAYPKILVENPGTPDRPYPLGPGPVLATAVLETGAEGGRPFFSPESLAEAVEAVLRFFGLFGEGRPPKAAP